MIKNSNNYEDKITFLSHLNINFWVKKPKSIKFVKLILICMSLYKNHKDLLESFQENAKKSEPGIRFDFFDNLDKLKLDLGKETASLSKYMILCNTSTKSLLTNDLYKFDEIYKNKLGNKIFIFNTLFESDNISNDMKKLIWADFQFFTKYE